MKKITLQNFRMLKQEIIDLFKGFKDIKEARWNFSEEQKGKLIALYKELSEYDLSDIDFEEWNGMYLVADENYPRLDLSKSKANLDFSIINFYNRTYYVADAELPEENTIPNFRNCRIKNFNFDFYYHSAMFDLDFMNENSEHFIFLDEINSYRINDNFYNGELDISDIIDNPKIIKKVSVNRLYDSYREQVIEYGEKDFFDELEIFIQECGKYLNRISNLREILLEKKSFVEKKNYFRS